MYTYLCLYFSILFNCCVVCVSISAQHSSVSPYHRRYALLLILGCILYIISKWSYVIPLISRAMQTVIWQFMLISWDPWIIIAFTSLCIFLPTSSSLTHPHNRGLHTFSTNLDEAGTLYYKLFFSWLHLLYSPCHQVNFQSSTFVLQAIWM